MHKNLSVQYFVGTNKKVRQLEKNRTSTFVSNLNFDEKHDEF